MKRCQILAHRGLWHKDYSKRNTLNALTEALREGFGLETDIRDKNEKIVISHDPPSGREPTYFYILLEELIKIDPQRPVAINIKSDGLTNLLMDQFSSSLNKIANLFYFDMSIPDGLAYRKNGMKVFGRLSEYERDLEQALTYEGVWIDNFHGQVHQVELAKKVIAAGKKAVIISPELHGREASSIWKDIRDSDICQDQNLLLCTDLVHEACEYFGGE